MGNILITGSTGFIGSHITECLHNAGEAVVCLVRSDSDLSFIKGLNLEVRVGDLLDCGSLAKALSGIETVIHCAAKSSDWGSREAFFQANVQGTINIMEACRKTGINRVILTGSISSYGEENTRQIKDETYGYNPRHKYFMDGVFPSAMNHYRESKAEATIRAVEFAARNSMDLTVIEPTWVYGEREFHTGFYEYVRSVKQGMTIAPGSRTNRFHVIYAQDLARAYLLAVRKKLPGVQRIIIGNRQAPLMDEIYTLFCRQAGVPKPSYLPRWVVSPVSFFLELAWTIAGSKTPPLLTRGRVDMFYDNIEYSTRKASEVLGFESQYSLEEGISRTVQWYKNKGLL